ncbi:hypothetical protein SMICM17S_09655 [Streptomyces microflavus]
MTGSTADLACRMACWTALRAVPQGVLGGGCRRLGDQAQRGGAVLDQRLDGGQLLVLAGGGLVQPLRGHRDPGELGEDRAQGAGGLAFGGQQPAQVAAELFGEGQQGEGLAERREVHDEGVVAAGGPVARGGAVEGVQEGELRGAGEFGELLAVEAPGSDQVQHAGSALLELGEFGAEVLAGVDPGVVEAVGDRGRFRAGGEAGYGLGGDQEGAAAARGGGQGGRRGDGRTACAAGTGDQDRTHRHQLCGTDSTRFFRPASARSMMTFSALRLIMPRSGILTSTASL